MENIDMLDMEKDGVKIIEIKLKEAKEELIETKLKKKLLASPVGFTLATSFISTLAVDMVHLANTNEVIGFIPIFMVACPICYGFQSVVSNKFYKLENTKIAALREKISYLEERKRKIIEKQQQAQAPKIQTTINTNDVNQRKSTTHAYTNFNDYYEKYFVNNQTNNTGKSRTLKK